jgi:hypothetical protein
MTMESKTVIRCAIYTRKSSEEGLEQSFNSLDAQREAGTWARKDVRRQPIRARLLALKGYSLVALLSLTSCRWQRPLPLRTIIGRLQSW